LLAAELCAVAPAGLTRVFYSEAGAAAVEVALRIALLAQRHRGQPQRTRFVSLEEAYHGDTAGAVSVGRSQPFHGGLEPLLFDALRVPPPHLAGEDGSREQLQAMFAHHGETVAALVIEPRMQAAAGMWPHTDAWLRDAVTIARQHGALIVCDEVATGFGRTGDLFASTGAGISPDIMVLGKGLTGGYLPLSATLVTEELFDLFTAPYTEHRTLYYGHTYSGNPLACAVARASLQLFATEQTLARAEALGAHLASRLNGVGSLPVVHDIRQRGVMVGIELGDEDGKPFDAALRMGRRVALAARRRHVIVRPLGDVLVINPPLAMSSAEADLLVDAITESIAEATTPPAMAVVG
jgi:adenosylmethionine-8-amino-7-oxononanoate aminotransferase